MKMLSKILSGAMVMALAAGMGITAFAASTPSDGTTGETSKEVKLNATLPEPAADYYVNIEWTSMEFNYTGAEAKSDWNDETHTYDGEAVNGTWSNGGTGTVKVTNNSNVQIGISSEYTSTDYKDGVANANGVTVDYETFAGSTLAAGDEENITGGTQTDNQATATVTVKGDPTASIPNVTAGTITVTISAVGD